MIAGIPGAGQVNALATLNIRGERSVTCKGDFDRHPSEGPLPPGAPPMCEVFRHYPDALERAAELDAEYGANPDLEKMPMYGVAFSFKDPFDTRDMRSTGGGDASYDIDFPARDHILVEQLRNKGAIIFAKAVSTEYNGRAGDPGGRHEPEKVLPSVLGYQRQLVGRESLEPLRHHAGGLSGFEFGFRPFGEHQHGDGEPGRGGPRASCRGPSNHNAVALILPHKAMLGFDGGAIGADIYCDRSGIITKSLADCAKVLDALKDPVNGYYDPRDPFTTVPRSSVLDTPYAAHVRTSGEAGALEGMRIGIIRESMVYPRGSKSEEPIVNAAARRDKRSPRPKARGEAPGIHRPALGGRPRDRDDENGFPARARKAHPPSSCPTSCSGSRLRVSRSSGSSQEAIVPTEFAPGVVFGSGDMQPIDYMIDMGEGRIEQPKNMDLATVQQQELAMTFRYHIHQYLSRRAEDWQARGFSETITGFPELERAL